MNFPWRAAWVRNPPHKPESEDQPRRAQSEEREKKNSRTPTFFSAISVNSKDRPQSLVVGNWIFGIVERQFTERLEAIAHKMGAETKSIEHNRQLPKEMRRESSSFPENTNGISDGGIFSVRMSDKDFVRLSEFIRSFMRHQIASCQKDNARRTTP